MCEKEEIKYIVMFIKYKYVLLRILFIHMALCAVRIRTSVEKAMLVGVRLTSLKTARGVHGGG